jgi:hypothetical protein
LTKCWVPRNLGEVFIKHARVLWFLLIAREQVTVALEGYRKQF